MYLHLCFSLIENNLNLKAVTFYEYGVLLVWGEFIYCWTLTQELNTRSLEWVWEDRPLGSL